jgi:hypothetical protein
MPRFELVTAWPLKLWYHVKKLFQLNSLNYKFSNSKYMVDEGSAV